MEQKFDINDFYMIEYVCSKCGNICSRNDKCCPVCKNASVLRTKVCRSCLEYRICAGINCGFVTHEEIQECPVCGICTIGCTSLIFEDHQGLPIPSMSKCIGSFRDDDEGVWHSRHLASYVKSKKEK